MQTNTKTINASFQPISLEILIETPEELDVLSTMLSYDLTIPEMSYPNLLEKQKLLQEMMTHLHKSLHQYL